MTTILIIILLCWALGAFGPAYWPAIPDTGGLIHVLLVIALVLFIVGRL